MADDQEAELFEAGPSGWNLPRSVLATYALVLVAGLAISASLSLRGASHAFSLLRLTIGVATVELVRVALQRSRRYVVTGSEVRLVQGVLRPRPVVELPADEVELRASYEGPVLASPEGEIVCRGLEPRKWADLADAVRRAGGSVSSDFAAPATVEDRPRPALLPVSCAATTLAFVATLAGLALEWRTHREAATRRSFVALVDQLESAVRTVAAGANTPVYTAWLCQRDDFNGGKVDPALTEGALVLASRRAQADGAHLAVQNHWIRRGDEGQGGPDVFSIGITVVTGPCEGVYTREHPFETVPIEGRRVRALCVRPAGVVPQEPTILLFLEDDPLTRIVHRALRAELDRIGVPYVVVPGG